LRGLCVDAIRRGCGVGISQGCMAALAAWIWGVCGVLQCPQPGLILAMGSWGYMRGGRQCCRYNQKGSRNMPDPALPSPTTGETTTRRIQLKVSSASPDLSGIRSTVAALDRMSNAMSRVDRMATRLASQKISIPVTGGLDVSRISNSLNQVRSAAASANAEIARIGRGARLGGESTPSRQAEPASRWLTTGARGLTPSGFGKNLLTVASWGVAAKPEPFSRPLTGLN